MIRDDVTRGSGVSGAGVPGDGPPIRRARPPRTAGRRTDSGRGSVAQAVGLAATVAALVFAILLLGSAWFRAQRRPDSVPAALPAASAAPEVDLWVGDLAEGVKAVLSSEWGEPLADARYDAEMNRDLGLPESAGLAYYRLTVFNTGDRPVTEAFPDGALRITPRGGAPLAMKSLGTLLEASGGPAARTLRWLGADRAEVEVPAGGRHSHPVAFERRVPLSEVVAVARADGIAFRPRRMKEPVWSALLASTSFGDLKGL